MEKKKISTEQRLEYSAAISYLENLLTAFKAGSIEVRKGERRIVLAPAPDVTIAIEAKQKLDKESFAMEISWQLYTGCKDGEEAFCISAISGEQPGNDAKKAAEPAQTGPPAQTGAAAAGTAYYDHDTEKKQAEDIKSADIKNKKSM
ncbi:MAG: amphi-Trp domain-containing protein [Desulfovibrio sp.]|jgi:amphi-Trp domain-containing protein|nr:amphi-Trp domain-containing protein [Desulfovibrio sp.]